MNTEDTSISEQPTTKPVIVIHGGAGWSQNTSDEIKDAIQAGLKTALDTGFPSWNLADQAWMLSKLQ